MTSVDALANFETTAGMLDNPYSEGNMLFSGTDLQVHIVNSDSYSSVPGFSGFVGNFIYGIGRHGFFEITAGGSNTFTGLEFIAGSGSSSVSDNIKTVWEAYDSGNSLVGSGSALLPIGTVIGFSDASGFKTLRFTSPSNPSTDYPSPGFITPYSHTYPAFDSVRAQFSNVSAVPEPSTILLLGAGLVGLAAWRKRRQA